MIVRNNAASDWWKTAVVYQIYPRSFADSNSDGIGDLAGIISRLDYLTGLGVDVIWLSPIYPSPQDDNGYDISDYQGIDPVFGTLEEFDRLVEEIHRRGMRLMMDLVVNHTSDEHPWFLDSRSSRNSAKRDWYWWRPPRAGARPGAPGAEPTNWGSAFSGSAWEFDEPSGEYYLHLFSRKQLNWENPEVRQAVYAMMRWWLDRGVDGFRMDVINMISKRDELADGDVPAGQTYGDGSPFFACGPRIHEFLREMHREVFASRPARLLTVGEMPGVTVEQGRLFTDPERAELDMVFQFEHVQLDQGTTKWDVRRLDLRELKASFARWQAGLADVGWNSLYWNNHDQPRAVSRFGDDGRYRVESAKTLATVLHLQRGTPYIYQGEELGMTNVPFSGVEDLRDIESINYFHEIRAKLPIDAVMAALRAKSRDNARTPMQWNAGPYAGFSTSRPWIMVNPNYTSINVEAALADPDSVFHHYRRLIELRHTDPVVSQGDFHLLLPDHPSVYAYLRRWRGVEMLVLGNFAPFEVSVDLPEAQDWAAAAVVVGRASHRIGQGGPSLVLQPWESRVYRREVPA